MKLTKSKEYDWSIGKKVILFSIDGENCFLRVMLGKKELEGKFFSASFVDLRDHAVVRHGECYDPEPRYGNERSLYINGERNPLPIQEYSWLLLKLQYPSLLLLPNCIRDKYDIPPVPWSK